MRGPAGCEIRKAPSARIVKWRVPEACLGGATGEASTAPASPGLGSSAYATSSGSVSARYGGDDAPRASNSCVSCEDHAAPIWSRCSRTPARICAARSGWPERLAKDLVDGAPRPVLEKASKEAAEKAKAQL